MATTPDDSFNLKHRLVGATVLILAAVILLPRVLTESDRDFVRSTSDAEQEALLRIEPEILAAIKPVAPHAVDVPAGTKIEILYEIKAVVDGEHSNGSANTTKNKDLIDSSGKNSALLPTQPSSDTVVGGFIAQVGVFREKKNLTALLEQLKNDGILAKTELIQVDGVRATRVWLGPFGTRSEALREGNRAMMRTNSKPMIVKWP